jgi:hypothetical protein
MFSPTSLEGAYVKTKQSLANSSSLITSRPSATLMFVVVHAALLAYAASPHAVPAPRFATTHRCAVLPTMADKEMLTCDVRKLPNSAIALDIHVPKAVSDEIHLKTLAKLAKSAKLDGFRDGKAPPQAVVAKLGLQKVKEATVEQIVDIRSEEHTSELQSPVR